MPEALLLIFYLIILLFLTSVLKVFRMKGLPFWVAPVLLLVKFSAGIGLAWIYSNYYSDRATADVFKLFDDSKHMYAALDQKPEDFFKMLFGLSSDAPYYDRYYNQMNHWFPSFDVNQGLYYDTRTLIRFNAFFRLFSMGYYSVHVLMFSFMALWGSMLAWRVFSRGSTLHPKLILVAVFLIPSVLAWTSGVLKESVVMLFNGMFLSGFFALSEKRFTIRNVLSLLLSILGFAVMKAYILLAILPGAFAWLIVTYRNFKQPRLTFVVTLLVSAVVALKIQYVFPGINFMETLSVKQQAMLRLAYYTDSGSVIFVNPLDPNLMSFLRNWPEALLNASFRPWVTEAENAMQWFSALENLVLALITLVCIVFYKKQEAPGRLAFLWFCLSFVLVLYSITGITTPILGTLVRYRMPALPFFLIAIFMMTDLKKMVQTVKQLYGYE